MPKLTWSNTAQYHKEAIKSVPVTEKHEKPLIKILKTWKNNWNKRIIPAILRNGTCTLLYLKVPKRPIQGETPQYQSESLNHILWSYWNSHNLVNIKEINRIWKIYQNIRMTPATMRNRTVVLLYSKALKHLACSGTPQHQSHIQNLIPGTGKH